jgi:hypothetical protein
MMIRVHNRVAVECEVSPAQAICYLRRVLVTEWGRSGKFAGTPPWEEDITGRGTAFGRGPRFDGRRANEIEVLLTGHPDDVVHRIARACEDVAAWGVVEQPGDALLAMSEEVVSG